MGYHRFSFRAGLAMSMLALFGSAPPALAAESIPQIDWIQQFGTPGDDSGAGASADQPQSPGAPAYHYTVGTVDGTLPGQASAGGTDGYLRKYDVHGNIQWTVQFGTSGNDRATGVVVSPNGQDIYVVGTTDGTFPDQTNAGGFDGFIKKFGTDGTGYWAHQFGTDGTDEFTSVKLAIGGIITAGRTTGAFPDKTNAGGFDAVVLAIDPDGTVEMWIDQFGSAGDDAALSVGSNTLINEVYVAATVASPLPDHTGVGGSDIVVRKYTNQGALNWSTVFGTPGNDDGAVVSASAGIAFVAARTDGSLNGLTPAGGTDIIVADIDTSGVINWSTQFGTAGNETATTAEAGGSPLGNYVSGYTTGTFSGQASSGGTDAFVAKFDYAGRQLWAKQFGTAGTDRMNGIGLGLSSQIDNSSFEIYGAGETTGTLSGQTSAGGTDAFAIHLIQDEDGDFIFNAIDPLPLNYTDAFSDGTTNGTIVDRGGQTLVIADQADPVEGVSIAATPDGTTDPAEVTICSDAATADLDPGDAVDVKCGSAIIGVKSGEVDTAFRSTDGTFTATSTYDAGNTLYFGVETNELATPTTNVDPVTVSIGSTEHTLTPGTKLVVVNAIADTFLRDGAENRNEGGNPVLVVRKQGDIRSLVRFDLSGISLTGLKKAVLVLSVNGSNAPDNWGKNGQLIDALRLTDTWSEGNGKDLDLPDPESTRGTGAGATWKCASDSDIADQNKDCAQEWDGADLASALRSAPGFLMKNNYTGQATWDVTGDMTEDVTHGWMIVKREKSKSGNVRFYSREGAEGNDNLTPQLVLEFDN